MFLGYNFSIMKKYLAWLGIFVLVSIFVTCKKEKYAHDSPPPTADSGGATVAPADKVNPASNGKKTEGYSPRWEMVVIYRVFSWPEGVTVWALFLTLITIAEQTRHTARAADTANKTFISTLRPKLIIRKIDIHYGTPISTTGGTPDADPWRVDFEVVNVGQGPAHVLSHSFCISRIDSGLPDETSYMEDEDAESKPFSLEPGEELRLSIYIGRELTGTLRIVGPSGLRLGYQNTNRIYFFGIAQYADDLGTVRNIAAFRRYDNTSTRFIPVDDPDREYSD
jgi:hypothetical protein